MADFQQHLSEFRGLNARVIALSTDSEADARNTVEQLGLHYDIVFGLEAGNIARLIGCYTGVRQGRDHLQPAAFVLAADGVIVHAVYSSGKVGRLTATDALTVLTDLSKMKAAAL